MKRSRISVPNNQTLAPVLSDGHKHLFRLAVENDPFACTQAYGSGESLFCLLQENNWGRSFDSWGSHGKRETEIRKIVLLLSTSR
jgi:hypothetical protein